MVIFLSLKFLRGSQLQSLNPYPFHFTLKLALPIPTGKHSALCPRIFSTSKVSLCLHLPWCMCSPRLLPKTQPQPMFLHLNLQTDVASVAVGFCTLSCLLTCMHIVLETLIFISADDLEPRAIELTLAVAVAMSPSTNAASSAYPKVCRRTPPNATPLPTILSCLLSTASKARMK